MDKRRSVEVVDLEGVPPWPLRISTPRLGREFPHGNVKGGVELARRGGVIVSLRQTDRLSGPIELRRISAEGYLLVTEEDES